MSGTRYLSLLVLAMTMLVAACAATASSPAPTPAAPVVTAEDAVRAVVMVEPRLAGIAPRDDELIGQSSWVEVAPASGVGAFIVAVRVGWGDCPAGCIDEHTWQYAVGPDGTVTLMAEAGDPVPPEAWPAPGGDGRTGVRIVATAGPVCPVEQDPPDPACAARPVGGAVIIIRDADGAEVARLTLAPDGTAIQEVAAGAWTVEALPVDGLMGTPGAVQVTVHDGALADVALTYDTGIR